MYTAKILRTTANKLTRKLLVDFAYHKDNVVEPVSTETKEFGIEASLEDLKRHAAAQIERLEKADTNATTITTGDLDLTGVKEELTAAEIAKREWFRNFGRLEQIQKLIDLGVLTGQEKPVTDLLAKVQTNFLPAYINEM